MSPRYAVIGAGRQGTAAAYDLIKFGEAEIVLLADSDIRQAQAAAERVNKLMGTDKAYALRLDASDRRQTVQVLLEEEVDAFVSAVPYSLNLGLTQAAIEAGCGMTDLGGNSQVVLEQMDRSGEAAGAGIAIVPDCGQVPGMGTSLILYAIEPLEEPRDVYMWDCGLPQQADPPWNYRLTFHIEGLTNEYYGDCLFIRENELTRVPALTEPEQITFPEPIGELEAFTTAGGLTTAARSFRNRLRTLQNKTLRYPGNFDQLKVIEQLGLLEPEPITVSGMRISPRELLHRLWEPQILADPDTPDFILIKIEARGILRGHEQTVTVQLIHQFDDQTGFTAMEQATGWHAAIMTAAIAHGHVASGVIPVERAMTGTTFVEEAARRGFKVERQIG